jgi:hypothetical protein
MCSYFFHVLQHPDLPVTEDQQVMSLKLQPPDLLKCPSYERYKQELEFWRSGTTVEKKKQGIVLALSLPTDDVDKSQIRSKVFEQVAREDIEKDTGYETLIAFFDKHLKKDELADSLEKFENFE